MTLNIFTDGGSRNNPGKAACAFVMFLGEKIIEKQARCLGIQTNNVAEYTGVVDSLMAFIKMRNDGKLSEITEIKITSDSSLLVNQLRGFYKIKKKHLADLVAIVKRLEKQAGVPVSYAHVLREKNREADFMVNKALDEAAA